MAGLRLIGSVSGSFEEVEAFLVGKGIADMADSAPKVVVGSSGGLSDQRLEL